MGMKRTRLYLLGITVVLAVLATGYGVEKWWFWHNYVRPVTWESWAITLPDGSIVRYTNQSPRMSSFGPADSTKRLTYVRPDGRSREYPISLFGGGYQEIEVRLRADRRAVWLIASDWKQVVATLDLDSGAFTGEGGVVYDQEGNQSMDAIGAPAWASLNGGEHIASKRFW
jgi:hypothetical protein